MVDLVLASSSPRRAELLRQINLSFRIVPPTVPERRQRGENASDYAMRLSAQKAVQVRDSLPGKDETVVLGADTVVVMGDEVLGKPGNRDEAVEMLMKLSGRSHRVITGITLTRGSEIRTDATETIVRFRALTSEECENYWDTGEPRDKAGAYGIQGLGAIFVASIQGSYSNVVGLPLTETAQALRAFGIDCLKSCRNPEQNLNSENRKQEWEKKS